MKKLNLREWSSFAEIIASVAVVISLVFVGYSFNQNSHALQATNDSLIFEIQDSIMSQLSGDPAMASILLTLERGEELTEIEAKQWEWHLWRWIAAWELAFNRHDDGLMDEERWVGWDEAFKIIVLSSRTGLPEEIWRASREAYGPSFASHVEAAYSKYEED